MDHQLQKYKEKIRIYKPSILINLIIRWIMVEFLWQNQSKKLVVENLQQILITGKASCKTEWQGSTKNNLINLSYPNREEN